MIRDHKSLTNRITGIITTKGNKNRHRMVSVTQPRRDNARYVYIFNTKQAGFMCGANLSYKSNSEFFFWLRHDIVRVQ